MKKLLLIGIASLLSTSLSFAQNDYDYNRFVKESGERSVLYRGEEPLIYNFRTNGTFYAFSENFEKGSVKYNGKIYKDVYLNLNSHLDELYVKAENSMGVTVLNKEFVENFSFGGRNFVNSSTGYYQVLFDGSVKLYKKITKKYEERLEGTSMRNQMERLFVPSVNYYLWDGKTFRTLKRMSDLLSYYKSERRAIRQMIRENGDRFRNDKDFSFAETIRFVESRSSRLHE